MTVAEQPSLYDVARVARRAVTARWSNKYQVPRLRTEMSSTAAPSVWMICPDWDKPAGGIRKQYRAVDALNAAGVPAAIVHKRAGFACSWFSHSTRIVAAADVVVGPSDVIVVPEVYGPAILDLPAGVRQVIFNQNAYLTLGSLTTGGAAAAAPYTDNPDLGAIIAVSDENAELLRHAFPDAPVRRIRLGIDPAIHHPPAERAGRRIAYMPRRRGDEAAQVLRLLTLRGVLEDWEVVAIDRCSERDAADLMRSSRIFLSFSEREGFGLPPCEALACGCVVVGFDGFAGREYFRPPFAVSVEDGDVVAFALAAERVVRHFEADPAGMAAAGAKGARFVLARYSPEAEQRDLIDVFSPLIAA
jgi:glycosyltransferase involved in cell wall biosynthesis